MSYSKAAISAYADKVRTEITGLEKLNINDLTVIISRGNSKLGKTLNVSLLPIFDCGNCAQCAPECYDIKACLRFKNVLRARTINSFIWENDPEKFFADIRKTLDSVKDNKFLRYQEAGDIPNTRYLEDMIKIAVDYPDFTFWTYTKMYALVNDYVRTHGGSRAAAIPANLSIMFSPWTGCPMDNPFNFPVFAVRMPNPEDNDYTQEEFNAMFHCPGNCNYCKAARRGCIAGESTWNDLH